MNRNLRSKPPKRTRKAIDNCALAVNFTKTTTIPLLVNNNQLSNHSKKTQIPVDNCIPSRKFKKMQAFQLLINNGKRSDALKKPMLLFTSAQIMEISRGTPSFISLSTRVNHQLALKRLE